VLNNRHLHAGSSQSLEALLRVQEERRRHAPQDLVRVSVERDHRRPGVPLCGFMSEVADQVHVAPMKAVEDPDDHEQAPMRWA